MKTTLKSIRLKGFRSFSEEAFLSFPETGLVLIQGSKDGSGVSSGSGKSSLLMGIAYAMGYCPYPATELQSWYGDNKLEVKLVLGTEKGDLTITRGTKSSLEGAIAVTGASATEDGIRKAVGLNTELLEALTYRPQRKPGLFLSKPNAEIQEFLGTLLGIGQFESGIDRTNKKIEELKASVQIMDMHLFTAKGTLEAVNKLSHLEPHDERHFKAVAESAFEIMQSAHQALLEQREQMFTMDQLFERNLETYKKDLANRYPSENPPVKTTTSPALEEAKLLWTQCSNRLTKAIRARDQKAAEVQKEIDKHSQAIGVLKREYLDGDKHQRRAQKLQEEIASLSAGKCSLCNQPWLGEETDKQIAIKRIELGGINTYLDKLPLHLEKVAEHQAAMRELSASLNADDSIEQLRALEKETREAVIAEEHAIEREYDKERAAYESRVAARRLEYQTAYGEFIDSFAAKRKAAQAVTDNLVAEYEKALNSHHTANNRLLAIEADNKAILAELETRESQRQSCLTVIAETEKALEEKKAELNAELDTLSLLKTFVASIFSEVLEEIAFNTNQMLAEIPNVNHITLRFKSETTVSKGVPKKSIVPTVMIGGEERPLKSALSGGMTTAVELAVDLAVRKVISARTGHTPGWLILDECFEGLGTTEMEACTALLQKAAQSTLILVVDHSTEFKESFNATVTIKSSQGRSRVV